jgi:hypothetical protein
LEREKQTRGTRRLLKDLQQDGFTIVERIERLETQLGISPESIPQKNFLLVSP